MSEVYIGLWSYNSLLTAGGLSYFLQPSLSYIPIVTVGAFMTVMLQAAILPLYLTVSFHSVIYAFELQFQNVQFINTVILPSQFVEQYVGLL